MTKYIDADTLIKRVKDLPTWWADGGGYYGGAMKYPEGMFEPEDVIGIIKNAPAADVVEVRHGRWEAWMPDKNGETREFICTGCRFMVEMSWKQKECDYEWCPYCGCKDG